MRTTFRTTSFKWIQFKLTSFFTIVGFLTAFFVGSQAVAQTPSSPADCRSGCTSNDVQITSAFLSDINGQPLNNYVCGAQNNPPVYLSLNLKTNTPRVGVSIYTEILKYDPATGTTNGPIASSPVAQCFGIALNTTSNVVTFTTPLNWNCAVGPIVLANTYTAWGTGNTNFCGGAIGTTSGFKCGGTPSKCHVALPGELIVVQLPNPNNVTKTKCSETAGSYLAHFDLTLYESEIKNNQSNTVKWYRGWTAPDNYSSEITGTDKTNFEVTSASTVVYAKVCDPVNTTVCSKAELTLNVNPLPTISGTLSVCVNSTTQLTGSGTAAATSPWTSSNTSIATVNSTGLVTGVSNGQVNITYKNSNGCEQTATVTVNSLPTISGTLSVCVNSTTQLTGSGTAAATSPWTSSNTSIATVNSTGLVTGVSNGQVNITYKNSNGCEQTATVTVNSLPTISGTLSVCVNSTTQLTGSGTAAATSPWTSSNTSIATVNSTGLVTGVSNGQVNITYKNSNGCEQTATVTVNSLPTISGTLSVCVNSTTQLTGSGTAAATSPWTSSNTSIATVNSTGLVTGVSNGQVNITYKNSNGCEQTATVTVNSLPTISGTLSVCVNSTTQLTGSGTAAATSPWTSSNTSIATVNSTGLVTGVSNGQVNITYKNSNGCEQTATVTVNAKPIQPTADVTQPTCSVSTGTITVTSSTSGLTFSINSTNPADFTNTDGVFSNLIQGDYTIRAKNSAGCISNGVTKTVNAPLSTPGAPTFTITQPSLCGPAKGSISICNSIGGWTYYVGNTAITPQANGASVVFTGLDAGSNPMVKVKNSDGCESTPVSCSAAVSSCTGGMVTQQSRVTPQDITLNSESKTSVLAAPNPFNDRIRFTLKANISGQGTLELYNMLGQKMKTVFSGYVKANEAQTIEYAVPFSQRANMIYLFRVGAEHTTGKLIGLKQ